MSCLPSRNLATLRPHTTSHTLANLPALFHDASTGLLHAVSTTQPASNERDGKQRPACVIDGASQTAWQIAYLSWSVR